MPRRRSRHSPNHFVLGLFVILALPVAVALVLLVVINPNDFKPQIANAVRVATGRIVTIEGDVTVGLGFAPTIQITQLRVANPPGFSRLDFAKVDVVEADVALIPLLWGEVNLHRLDITEPDVLLETNALGEVNWRFTPAGTPTPPSAASAGTASASGREVVIGNFSIYGGKLASLDDTTGTRREITINRVAVRSSGQHAPATTTLGVTIAGHDLAMLAETGPIERLLGRGSSQEDWPVQVTLRSEGAQISMAGSIQQPLSLRGYRLSIEASLPDLGPLGALAGGGVPALHDVQASAKLRDNDGVPEFSALVARAGVSELGNLVPGLILDRMVFSAPSPTQPMRADLAGMLGGKRLQLTANFGAPASVLPWLLWGGATPAAADVSFPIDMTADIAGGHFAVKGAIARPMTLSGLDATVSLQVPDLADLSAIAGRQLPTIANFAFSTRVTDVEGGAARGIVLHDLALSGAPMEMSGDLTFGFAPREAVSGTISGQRLDLDAIQADSALAKPSVLRAASRAVLASRSQHVISDEPIDFARLDAQDVDLRVNLAEIRSGGTTYRDFTARLLLNQGKLTLDPFTATAPNGRLDLRLLVDPHAPDPIMAVAVTAPGVTLKPWLTAFGLPDDVTGTVEASADLTASGRTPHALAASLSGRLGVVMNDGEVDNRLLGSAFNDVLRVARLPPDLVLGGSGGGRTKLRCAATRIDTVHGLSTLTALDLETRNATLAGGGTVNLVDESIAMRLLPMVHTGGPSVVIPVRVTGTLASPNAVLDASGTLDGLSGSATSGPSGLMRNPMATLGNALSSGRQADLCATASALARGARAATK
jgi:uncharacterized protein involved in outer membrane biogenesis